MTKYSGFDVLRVACMFRQIIESILLKRPRSGSLPAYADLIANMLAIKYYKDRKLIT
jgi:hypothetical protein